MKRLLLVIDYQYDFVADDGLLTAGQAAQAIEGALLRRIQDYREAGDDVLCTLDTHAADSWGQSHPEGRKFPLHCTENSPGWQLYGQLAGLGLETLTKTTYMLDQADLDWLVRQYELIELAGLTTDICVLQNAIGLYNHAVNQDLAVSFQVAADCVASFDPAGHQYALDYLQRILGFKILNA
ncbi:MAG TPA: isochorismatase [Clostridiales bacterium]|nr:isochorismatase [Clostridiales bacterium]